MCVTVCCAACRAPLRCAAFAVVFLLSANLALAAKIQNSSLSVIVNLDGTHQLKYSFNTFQSQPATEMLTVPITVKFWEDDPPPFAVPIPGVPFKLGVGGDDHITTITTSVTISKFATNSSTATITTLPFDPAKAVGKGSLSEGDQVEYYAEVCGDSDIGLEGAVTDNTVASINPPQDEELDIAVAMAQFTPGNIIQAEFVDSSVVASLDVEVDALVVEPLAFPFLQDVGGTGYLVRLLDVNGNAYLDVGRLNLDNWQVGAEAFNLGEQPMPPAGNAQTTLLPSFTADFLANAVQQGYDELRIAVLGTTAGNVDVFRAPLSLFAVPEPSTFALAAMYLGMIGFTASRKKETESLRDEAAGYRPH